jgi:hypothetical protein
MSHKNNIKNTDQLMADDVRRVFPPYKRVFKDRNKYDRKAFKGRNDE